MDFKNFSKRYLHIYIFIHLIKLSKIGSKKNRIESENHSRNL